MATRLCWRWRRRMLQQAGAGPSPSAAAACATPAAGAQALHRSGSHSMPAAPAHRARARARPHARRHRQHACARACSATCQLHAHQSRHAAARAAPGARRAGRRRASARTGRRLGAPAARQGHLFPRQPLRQSQPGQRSGHAASHAQNLWQKCSAARHVQAGPHAPTHPHGAYAGQASARSCLSRVAITCVRPRHLSGLARWLSHTGAACRCMTPAGLAVSRHA